VAGVTLYISGVIVMFLVAFGLRQLKLAKDQISLAREQIETSKNIFKTQSRRASVEAAVIECRRFSETIVQDSLALDKFIDAHELTYFEKVKFEKIEKGFKIDISDINDGDVKKLAEAEELINRFINGLESHALYFLSGVADEEIAFHTNAKTYLEFCETAFKLFPILNASEEDAAPIKKLYFMWHEKYEAKRLRIEKSKIDAKLSSYKESRVRAIGT
jgi:hypothetical protein